MQTTSPHHGHRLRHGRYSEIGRIYLVTTVVRNRQPLFNQWGTARTCARTLHLTPRDVPAASIAWIVMPDHLHWLLRLEAGNLADVMRHFKSRSAREINRVTGCAGTVWQPGYHDRTVRREEDVRALARYVVANPLRAGLCQSVLDYPFWDAVWLDGNPENPLDP